MKQPCSVERTHRSVIECKLLTALEDDNTVAALFSKQDLEDTIAALYGYEIGERNGNVLSWEAHVKRRKDLADALSQLLREAFPPLEANLCPKCQSVDISKAHHSGTFAAPECDYWTCSDCDHQWGHS